MWLFLLCFLALVSHSSQKTIVIDKHRMTGTQEHDSLFSTEYMARELVHKIGNPLGGNPPKETAPQPLTFPMQIFRNGVPGSTEHISDFAIGAKRLTEQGVENSLCDPPLAATVDEITFCISKRYKGLNSFSISFSARHHDDYKCKLEARTDDSCDEYTINTSNKLLTFTSIQVLKSGTYIDYMKIFQSRLETKSADCGTKPVAVVQRAISGLILTQSRTDYLATEFVESEEHETAIYSEHTESSEAKAKTVGEEISIDLTDRVMISYLVMLPCKIQGSDAVQLNPVDSRVRRLFLPIEACTSNVQSGSTSGSRRTRGANKRDTDSNTEVQSSGQIDLSVGSCTLSDKFQWLDRENLLADAMHVIDIPKSNVHTTTATLELVQPRKIVVTVKP